MFGIWAIGIPMEVTNDRLCGLLLQGECQAGSFDWLHGNTADAGTKCDDPMIP